MLKVMDLKIDRKEILITIMFYILVGLILVYGAERAEKLGLNYIDNNIVENITR